MRLRFLAVVGAVTSLVLAFIAYGEAVRPTETSLEVFGDAPWFELADQMGRPVRSDELRGKVVLANFVYTNCQESCPLLSLRMQAVKERLRQEGLLDHRVQLLSFTVDPEQDTPEVLRAYAERHEADPRVWRFLTGPKDVMVRLLTKGFLVGTQAVPLPESTPHQHDDGEEHHHTYEVMHSNRFVLIDRQWRVRAYYDGLELDLERVVRDIRQFVDEKDMVP